MKLVLLVVFSICNTRQFGLSQHQGNLISQYELCIKCSVPLGRFILFDYSCWKLFCAVPCVYWVDFAQFQIYIFYSYSKRINFVKMQSKSFSIYFISTAKFWQQKTTYICVGHEDWRLINYIHSHWMKTDTPNFSTSTWNSSADHFK